MLPDLRRRRALGTPLSAWGAHGVTAHVQHFVCGSTVSRTWPICAVLMLWAIRVEKACFFTWGRRTMVHAQPYCVDAGNSGWTVRFVQQKRRRRRRRPALLPMLPSRAASSKHNLQVRAPTPPLFPYCPSTHPPHVPTWDARAICSHADRSADDSGSRSHPDHPRTNPLSDHQSANPHPDHPSANPHPDSSALVQPGWYCAVNVAFHAWAHAGLCHEKCTT